MKLAALALSVIGGTAALAQDNARKAIGEQGSDALERLKGAIAGSKTGARDSAHPVLPDLDRTAERRRAFEGLRRGAVPSDMEVRARAAHRQGETALAAERERQARTLRQALGLEPSEEQAIAKAPTDTAAKKTASWVPVVFASSSMPIAVLRSYAGQLERTRGVLAFRGMPGGLGKAGPMAELTARILRRDPGCEGPACAMRDVQIIVDPLVFHQHAITRVPALAMIPGDPTQAYCERDDASPRAAHLVYGDSALPGLIEEYARLGGKEEVRHVQALMDNR
jgi:hypothetical protein